MHAALTESSDVLVEPPRRSERRSKSTATNASSDDAQAPAEASEADLASMDTVASLLAALKTQVGAKRKKGSLLETHTLQHGLRLVICLNLAV